MSRWRRGSRVITMGAAAGRLRLMVSLRKGGSFVAPPVLSVAIHGATGRMGTRLIQLIQADPALRLGAALDRGDHPRIGEDAGTLCGVGPLGVPLSASLAGPVDVAIDFSLPAGTLALAAAC